MNAFDEFSIIIRHLEKNRVRYALIGGVAMAFYAEPRFTQDIDLLLDANDLEKVRSILEENGYFESSGPWTLPTTPLTLHRFLKTADTDQMIMDLLVAADEFHLKIIQNAREAEGEQGIARVAEKSDIIQLKRNRNSLQDQADIERLLNEKD